MKLYAVHKEGNYIQECFGIFNSPKKAKAAAKGTYSK